MKNILLATDLGPNSDRAMERAIKLAKEQRATLHVVHVAAAPELITVAIAAWHKQTDVVIGNILDSNIFNLLAIGGVAALVAPISVDDHFITVDLPLLVVISMALVVLALILPRIGRRSGLVLLAGYAAYTAILF